MVVYMHLVLCCSLVHHVDVHRTLCGVYTRFLSKQSSVQYLYKVISPKSCWK